MTGALVDIRNLSKSFGGVQALRNVSLSIARGEVHALCGQNGAGKSTLIKVLCGACTPDAGRVHVCDRRLSLGSVHASEAAAVAVIHQEPVAFGHLTAADNIFVGREPRRLGGLLLDRRRMGREAAELLGRLGARVDPRAPVGELPMAQRQLVSMARALARRCRLLILDEPTASLSGRETKVLFDIIRRLRASGVGVLYVSHRLEEVFELADRVTVLRDGRLVATRAVGEVDRASLIGMMVGREVDGSEKGSGAFSAAEKAPDPFSEPPASGAPLLEVLRLTRRGAFQDVSLTIHAGEVVALAGLVGAGRSELARAVFGVDLYDAGQVRLAGRALPPGCVRAGVRRGLALVPEDRQHQGLVLPMSVSANLTLAVLRSLTWMGLTIPAAERRVVEKQMRDLDVRASSARAAAETLSGGNQQKLVLGKWLAARPSVLILDEPTRGVDVAAKAEVHRLIRDLARRGRPRPVGVLMISSELPEVLAVADRILVMRQGRISGELSRREATREKVLALALPVEAGAAAGAGGQTGGRP